MSWAMIASVALPAIAGFLGGQASSKAASASRTAAERAEEQSMELKMKQYDEWERIYGPVRESLGAYYNTLRPDSFAAKGLQNLQKSYEATEVQRQRSRAQQNVDGAAASALDENAQFNLAQQGANIRSQAPLQVAQAKQGFLNSNVSNPNAGNLANGYQSQANRQFQDASDHSADANRAYAQAGAGASKLLGLPSNQWQWGSGGKNKYEGWSNE